MSRALVSTVAALLMAVLLVLMPHTLQAQDSFVQLPVNAYMLAPDANDITQVWRLPADGSEHIALTNAPASITEFAVSADAALVAYTSDGTLWLQGQDGSTPEALVTLASDTSAAPVFSPDGTQIAYADNGVWLLVLETGETRQLVENVPLPDMGADVYDRYYVPVRFVGEALIVSVRVWEGYTVGVIDLDSGALTELEAGLHTSALPLPEGRLLLYGNGAQSGAFDLQTSDMAFEQRETVLDFTPLDGGFPLFVEQAVEIQPGIVRLVGTTFQSAPDYVTQAFWFDFDLTTGEMLGDVTRFDLPVTDTLPAALGALSPDGRVLPLYQGETLTLHDLESGDAETIAEPASMLQWHTAVES